MSVQAGIESAVNQKRGFTMKTAFTIFLLVYSYIKYTAVPSQMGEPMYMATTALVVILTAVIPFFIARHLLAKASPPKSYVLAAFVPLALSAIGLAIYFYMFIAPTAPGMAVTQVLPRAIAPGLVMSAILLIPILMSKKDN